VGICAEPNEVERRLNLRARGAPVEVWLFDDAALSLYEHGVRMRLRVRDNASVLTLKVANQDCMRVSSATLPAGQGKCEYDVHGESMAGAVSLDHPLDAAATGRLLNGVLSLTNALSDAQAHYLRDRIALWPLPNAVRPLGPIKLRRYSTPHAPYDVDSSELPDGSRYVEISRKVRADAAERASDELDAYLSLAAVARCADQSAQGINKLRTLLATSGS